MSKRVLITLLSTCMIAGLPRSPVEGAQEVDEDEAERLIDAGMAEMADIEATGEEADSDGLDDDLGNKSVKDLRALAEGEGIAVKGNASKPDLIAAIEAGRERKAFADELDGLDKAQLVERAKADDVTVADDAEEAAIREAITAKHFPPAG